MADTVTAKLGLTKPEIGASNNTWGTKVNGNFDILDAKIVRNSIQWTVTPGDDNPASATGSFIVTRYNNSQIRVDDPLIINRQTGDVTITDNLNVTGKTTNDKVYSVKGAVLGSGNYTAPAAAFVSNAFNYIGDNLSLLSNGGLNYTSYNLYYDSGLKNYAAGFSGYMAYNYGNGNFSFYTSPVSNAKDAVTNATNVMNIRPSGLDVVGIANISSTVQAPYMRLTSASAPGTPAGAVTIFVDGAGNPVIQLPNGTVRFLGIPPGTIAWTAGGAADVGWAICNGAWVSKAANPALTACIGNIYGGDANNVGLPDIRGRVIAGVDNGETNRLANTIGAANLGSVGGLDYHTLTAFQTPPHIHGFGGAVNGNTGDDTPDHTHQSSSIIINTASGAGITAAGVALQANVSNPISLPPSVKHRHPVNLTVIGTIDNGSPTLGGSWHPNLQPTICLIAQIKLG